MLGNLSEPRFLIYKIRFLWWLTYTKHSTWLVSCYYCCYCYDIIIITQVCCSRHLLGSSESQEKAQGQNSLSAIEIRAEQEDPPSAMNLRFGRCKKSSPYSQTQDQGPHALCCNIQGCFGSPFYSSTSPPSWLPDSLLQDWLVYLFVCFAWKKCHQHQWLYVQFCWRAANIIDEFVMF